MKKLIFAGIISMFFSITSAYNINDIRNFRETGECSKCDLSSAIYLSSASDAPYDLSFANLTRTYFSFENASGSDFSSANASQATFISQGGFSSAKFVGALLIEADFSHQNLSYANFSGANVNGANFSYANLYGAKGLDLSVLSSVCNAILPTGMLGKCKN